MTVVVFSGIMVGTTVIAGMLMRNQIRQTVGIIQANQAIYAADTGIEWELYRFFVNETEPKPIHTLSGVSFQTCSPIGAQCQGGAPTRTIRSIGLSGRASRAFEVILE